MSSDLQPLQELRKWLGAGRAEAFYTPLDGRPLALRRHERMRQILESSILIIDLANLCGLVTLALDWSR
jgi:hypothetical protein